MLNAYDPRAQPSAVFVGEPSDCVTSNAYLPSGSAVGRSANAYTDVPSFGAATTVFGLPSLPGTKAKVPALALKPTQDNQSREAGFWSSQAGSVFALTGVMVIAPARSEVRNSDIAKLLLYKSQDSPK